MGVVRRLRGIVGLDDAGGGLEGGTQALGTGGLHGGRHRTIVLRDVREEDGAERQLHRPNSDNYIAPSERSELGVAHGAGAEEKPAARTHAEFRRLPFRPPGSAGRLGLR